MTERRRRRNARVLLAAALAASALVAVPRVAGAVVAPVVAPGQIATVAGSAGVGDGMDIAQAPSALAEAPGGILVGDTINGVVRLLETTGNTMTVVAGASGQGFDEVMQAPTLAHLPSVSDVEMDASGVVIIAGGSAVWRIPVGGALEIVVGGPPAGFAGGGSYEGVAMAPNGDVFWSVLSAFGQSVGVTHPNGSSENLVTWSDGTIPGDVDLAPDGSLYYVRGHQVLRRMPADGSIVVVAGPSAINGGYNGDGIDPTTALLKNPSAIDLEGSDMWIADTGNHRVRLVSGGLITTVAGDGTAADDPDGTPATGVSFDSPSAVLRATDGSLYVTTARHVRAVRADLSVETLAGNGELSFSGDGGAATAAQFRGPSGVAASAGGHVLVADTENNRIRRVADDGTITTIAGTGVSGFGGEGGDPLAALLDNPEAVIEAPNGDIFVADTGNDRIRRISGGAITTVAGTGVPAFNGDGAALLVNLDGPAGLGFDGDGDLLISDTGHHRVRELSGGVITTIVGNGAGSGPIGDGGPPLSARLDRPRGLALDGNGDLLIADTDLHRVRRVAGGSISTIAGNGICVGNSDGLGDGGAAVAAQICSPAGVAVIGDVMFVLSLGGKFNILGQGAPVSTARLRRIGPSGIIQTVVGQGKALFAGDGGVSLAGRLSDPRALAVDADGGILIADRGNNRVRKVMPGVVPDAPGAPSGVAGDTTVAVSWSAPVSDGGWPVTSYTVTASPGGATCSPVLPSLTCTVVGLTNGTAYTFTVRATSLAGDSAESVPSSPVTPADIGPRYRPLTPFRVLDSRDGTGGFSEPFHGGLARAVTVTGGPVPPTATAVVLTVTAILPTEGTHVTIWPDGQLKPNASNLNVAAGDVKANTVIATIGAAGQVDVVSNSGDVHLVLDVTGYYESDSVGGVYTGLTPNRIVDSRDGTGGYATPWGPSLMRPVQVTGGAVPVDATAVALTITAILPSSTSHLTVWPDGQSQPVASNLNFRPGDVIANTVIATVGAGGIVDVFNNSGDVHLAIDITGYYTDDPAGAVYTALTPNRIVDSRDGTGGISTAWGPATTRQITVSGGAVPGDVTAVVLTVTAILPTATSHATVWPDGQPRPLASNLNYDPGEVIANTVIATVGPGGVIDVFNNSGEVNIAIDLTGYYR